MIRGLSQPNGHARVDPSQRLCRTSSYIRHMMMRFLLPVVLVLTLMDGACSTIPADVDLGTLDVHRRIVREQQDASAHPLVGIYRISFNAEAIVQNPEQATPITGDMQVAIIVRSGTLDVVSLSGFRNFGALSDQGAGFSVNLQGAALWRFPVSAGRHGERLPGQWTGVRGPRSGDAALDVIDGGWLRIMTWFPSKDAPTSAQTAFLNRIPT